MHLSFSTKSGNPYVMKYLSFFDSKHIFFVFLLCLFSQASFAGANKTTKYPPLIEADNISYDENTNIITAIGNVEIGTSDRVLKADKVSYNKNTDILKAIGNIAIKESSGEILFVDEIEVSSDLKEGFLNHIGILFPDNSKMAANNATRYQGRYLIANHGIYTACKLCNGKPLWQVKGVRVTHDAIEKDIIYRDATIEFAGIPIFYTPYFSHPDPTVKRREGFLTPSGGIDDTIGTFARTPYYFDIAPNNDLTITPTISTEDILQLATDWRYRFSSGRIDISSSIANANLITENGRDVGKKIRGHLFGSANYNINNKWRAGAKINYTSDKSYLQRYSLPYEDILVNRGYVEYFNGRNYGSGNVYYFIDQRPNNVLVEPIVAPEIRYSAIGEPSKTFGGRWSFDSSLLVTTRKRNVDLSQQGSSTRRLSINGGWERQLISNTGFLTTVSGNLRADSYWADNVPDPKKPVGTNFSNISRIRPFAQANLEIKYPLGRHGNGYQQIIEPIAMLSVAPNISNNKILPNEDSLDIEFDETNLFLPSRYTGIDKIEGGTRIAYGMRHSIIGDNGSRLDMVIGQIYRFKKNNTFLADSGLNDNFSDIVGHVNFYPRSWFDLSWGFRVNKNDLSFTKQEAQTSFGNKYFRPTIRYTFLKQTNSSTLNKEFLEEINYGVHSQISDHWALSLSHLQAIQPNPGARNTSISLTYADECFKAGITGRRDHTKRIDVKEGSSILFHFYLRNIGGFSSD